MTDPIEDRLAQTLRLRAATAHVSADAYPRILERAARARVRSTRLRLAAVGVVAAIVVLAVTTPLLLDARRADDPRVLLTEPPPELTPETATVPTPATTPTATVAPTSAPTSAPAPPPAVWSRMDDAGLATGGSTYLEDLAVFGGGLVAVGSLWPEGADVPRGAVWFSQGRSWSLLDGDERTFGDMATADASLNGLAEGGGVLVAVGSYDGPAAWRSVDARDWERIPLDGDGIAARAVAWTGTRFVAVGEDAQRGPAIWRSADGLTWDSRTFDLLGVEGVLDHVAVSGDLVVALGRSSVVVSADGGETWTQRGLGEAGFDPETSAFEDVVALGDGTLLAVAVAPDAGPTTYSSPDGLTWTVLGDFPAGTGTQRVSELIVGGDGTVTAVGLTFGSTGVQAGGTIWTSEDGGVTWVTAEGVFGPGTMLSAVTRSDAGLVAIGVDETSGIPRGAAWILAPHP